MTRLRKRWLWLALIVFVSVPAVAYVAYREVDRQSKEMLESKWVRTSAATVIRKNEGRVYYKIDNFDNLPEPRRTRAAESEERRMLDSAPRYIDSVDWYDRVQAGSRIYVRYQCFSDGKLEIVGVDTNRY